MKQLPYTVRAEQHEYMRKRQAQNRARSATNPNEQWMAAKLQTTGYKWTPQAQWGFRLFDFWSGKLGVAIEEDGQEHDREKDNYEDEYNFRRSAIVVLRVRNRNEEDAERALAIISKLGIWQLRREQIGIAGNTKKAKRVLAKLPYDPENLMLHKFLCDLA